MPYPAAPAAATPPRASARRRKFRRSISLFSWRSWTRRGIDCWISRRVRGGGPPGTGCRGRGGGPPGVTRQATVYRVGHPARIPVGPAAIAAGRRTRLTLGQARREEAASGRVFRSDAATFESEPLMEPSGMPASQDESQAVRSPDQGLGHEPRCRGRCAQRRAGAGRPLRLLRLGRRSSRRRPVCRSVRRGWRAGRARRSPPTSGRCSCEREPRRSDRFPTASDAFTKTFHEVLNREFTIEGGTATGTVYCVAHHLTAARRDPSATYPGKRGRGRRNRRRERLEARGGTDAVWYIRYLDDYRRTAPDGASCAGSSISSGWRNGRWP